MPERAPGGSPDSPARRRHGRRGLRRAASQAGLVLALLAVFTVSSAAAGTCALMLTAGNADALSAAVVQADGSENSGGVDVTTVVVNSSTLGEDVPPDAATVNAAVRGALAGAAGPYAAQVSVWTSTPMLYLEGRDVRCGYLLDADTIAANASLVAGGWPAERVPDGRIPVAIPGTTADALGVAVGSEVRLSLDRHNGVAAAQIFDLVITGVFTPAETPAWFRDTLHGRGFDPDYLRLPTYGPFVVAPGTLEELAAPAGRVAAVLDPDLDGNARDLPAFVDRLENVATDVKDVVGPGIDPVVVRSELGPEFGRLRSELSLTDALVATVFVLVLVTGAATAALVARVLVGRRGAESTLLRDRGASTRQLVGGAASEAAAIAVVAAVVAAPLTLGTYRLLAPGSAAWSAVALPLALALLAGAILPAAVLVIASLPERPRGGRQLLTGPVARSGIDVMLVVVAIVAYVQLGSHVPSPGVVDPLLVLAPAVCVLAMAALVARLLPVAARAAGAAARRSRAFVLPMAGWHVGRGGAIQGAFLLVLATSVGTLGVTFLGTWSASQGDQAAALVGSDLVVAQAGGPGMAGRLAGATGGTVAPVADRAVVLGGRPAGVKILAIDAARADRLLPSRPPDGTSWSATMAGLAPSDAGAPLTVASAPAGITVTGGVRKTSLMPGLPVPVVTAIPTLVLVDEAGATTTLLGSEVALDGRPHATKLPLPGQQAPPPGTWRVVAIDLLLSDHSTGDLIAWGNSSASVTASVTVDGASSSGSTWGAAGDTGQGAVRPGDVSVRGDTVDAAFTYSVLGLSWEDAHLTLLSFPASTEVPVAMTAPLAAELGLAPGDRMALAWGGSSVEVVLVRTVPYVPAHVREAALLADLTSLQRAVLTAGVLDAVTDAWWVGSPRPGAAAALRAAGTGPVSDRVETAAALRDGPLRSPVRTAWLVAIAASAGLALTGAAAHAAAEAQRRAVTIARVRAIGASRRESLASHLVQHAAVVSVSVALGAACGAVLAWLLAPLLVITPAGERAVPSADLVWSAGPTAAVVGVILLGAVLAGVPAALAVVGRSTVAALRAGEAS